MSTTEPIAKLLVDLEETEKALLGLAEKREMCKSTLAKLDAEEHAVSRKLQDTRARFRGFVGLGLADPALYSAVTPGTAGNATPKAEKIKPLSNNAEWDHLAEAIPSVRIEPPVKNATPRTIAGPETEDTYTIDKIIAARTISTYPMTPDRSKRVRPQQQRTSKHSTTHNDTRTCDAALVLGTNNSKGRPSATSTASRRCRTGRLCVWRTGATGV